MASIRGATLDRGPCHSECSVYWVTLDRRGSATWEGEAYTERTGRYRGRVDVGEFGLLASFIARSGFFDWKDDYLPSATESSICRPLEPSDGLELSTLSLPSGRRYESFVGSPASYGE